MQNAAFAERWDASEQLAKTVQEFGALSATALTSDPKKMRKEVQKSLRAVTKELARYDARIAASNQLYSAEKALRKSTLTYLAKNK